ncbi:restriction endonuclease subunit S [Empedobacter sp. R132-2]|uniref:restriction endonuclease subunit S n=1 Tax=Empedobacter sp. R132-2 TaxID=2746740 RepID=UPI002578DA95|nr:restriction endonuclease subunit S [Empedobacter sp. R132-2]MDM1139190.1 restriction endonuclease subunit S [Empedobacter sp. R132-2]
MNYKRLGDYIIEKVEFNEGNKYDLLQGVSNNKYFQKAKTNTIGVDLSKYRVAHHNQFVFNRATTRNGDKISIALRKGESCIVSPSYRIFEVKDENVLNPDYLLMWFKRPEFDRYARFKSHGSAHEFFDMDEMNDVELPIPSIEKQREIVAQYQAVANKIKVNERICEKLEATAQTLYKQWFVDFEFPNEEGQPYKSSGGAMVYNQELEKEIPEGWEVGTLKDICNVLNGFAFDSDFYSFENGIKVLRGENVTERALRWDTLKYYDGEMNPRIERCFLKTNDIVIGMDGSKVGKNWSLIGEHELPMILAQRVACLRSDSHIQNFIYQTLINLNFEYYCSQVHTGTSIPHISSKQIEQFELLIPNEFITGLFENTISKLRDIINIHISENQKLTQLQSLLLSRLATLEG